MNAIGGVGNSWGLVGNSWGKGGIQAVEFLKEVQMAPRIHEPLKNSWGVRDVLVPEKAGKLIQPGNSWGDKHIDLQA